MRRRLRTLLLCGLALGLAHPASAASISFGFGTTFSNNTVPGGPAPWMTGTLSDVGTVANPLDPGELLMTLNTSGLTGTEFFSGVYFNFDPTKDLSGLNVTLGAVDNTGGAYTSADIAENTYKADGDGYFDIRLNFSQNPPRLDDNSVITFVFSHDTVGLVLDDFIFQSAPGNDTNEDSPGPFYAAAHLQGIGPNGALSTWVATTARPTLFSDDPDPIPAPEPTSMLLLGSGLLGLAHRVRRRMRTR